MMTPADRLRSRGRLETDVPLGPLTTYKIGGPARYLVTVDEEQDAADGYLLAASEDLPLVALGRGSNVVVADRGFEGVVLRPGPGLASRDVGEVVTAGSAVPLPVLAREAARAGRGGLEFFTGIPGSVGGAVRMNAGCHGSETADVLISARIFDAESGETSDRGPDDLEMAYRHSSLSDSEFVLEASFRTVPRKPEESEAEIKEITRWRREHQPGGTLNAGSVFKNPSGDAAGRIVDELGLKGLAVGPVSVSERHANFFVAGDGSTAADIKALVDEVAARVLSATGIALEPEIRFLGAFE